MSLALTCSKVDQSPQWLAVGQVVISLVSTPALAGAYSKPLSGRHPLAFPSSQGETAAENLGSRVSDPSFITCIEPHRKHLDFRSFIEWVEPAVVHLPGGQKSTLEILKSRSGKMGRPIHDRQDEDPQKPMHIPKQSQRYVHEATRFLNLSKVEHFSL